MLPNLCLLMGQHGNQLPGCFEHPGMQLQNLHMFPQNLPALVFFKHTCMILLLQASRAALAVRLGVWLA